MKSFEIQISAGFYIGLALAVLTLPWRILLAFGIGALFHELCHLAALGCCRIPVRLIRIGLMGAEITTAPMLPGQELICAAAGPLGSLLLVGFARWMPELALFGLAQGVFNLLPIYPLDGGRVVRGIFMLAKTAQCDYNRPDYKQRGIYHDGTDSTGSACGAETGPVYRWRV